MGAASEQGQSAGSDEQSGPRKKKTKTMRRRAVGRGASEALARLSCLSLLIARLSTCAILVARYHDASAFISRAWRCMCLCLNVFGGGVGAALKQCSIFIIVADAATPVQPAPLLTTIHQKPTWRNPHVSTGRASNKPLTRASAVPCRLLAVLPLPICTRRWIPLRPLTNKRGLASVLVPKFVLKPPSCASAQCDSFWRGSCQCGGCLQP